jgi:polysaccharide export outer membrane protein
MKDFVVEERSRMGSRTAVIRAALAGALLAVATATAAAQVPTIAPADQVRVTVVGTELPTGPFTVDADGSIDYPFLGRIEARGLTARALGDLIAKRLVEAEVLVGSPQVMVDLLQTPNKTVTVSGAVNNRGEYRFAGQLTVFDALVRAGGAAPDAGDEVLLIRAPKEGDTSIVEDGSDVITLSRRRIESGEFGEAYLVEDGDRIIVNRARQVYIDGYVNRPGGYTIEPGMTLRQALALAGGVTELGAVNRIRVLRNGKRLENVELDTTIIEPGDTITVPKRFM